jgi:hypothetical protein
MYKKGRYKMAETKITIVPHTHEEGLRTDTTIVDVQDENGFHIIVAINDMVETIEEDLKKTLGFTSDVRWDDVAPFIDEDPYYLNSALYIIEQNGNPLVAVEGLARIAPFMEPSFWNQLEERYPSA